jgi:hypothetical protein
MELKTALELIENIAKEHNYHMEQIESNFWEAYIDRDHGIAYGISCNQSGYINIRHWEGKQYGDGQYGRSIYSLRTIKDVVKFCNIMVSSEEIRAKR